MLNPIDIFVPKFKQIITISEGNGMNLLDEDMDEGFVDYIYYDQYDYNLEEVDGGQIMLTEMIQDKYTSMKECIPAVLDMAYGDASIEYIVLE